MIIVNNPTDVGIKDGAVTTAKIADANVTPAKLSQPFTRGTAVATTSGTSIDFTGIPSWVKRITVIFNGVSTSGSSPVVIRFGTSSGVAATGYMSNVGRIDSAGGSGSEYSTTGFILAGTIGAGSIINGNHTSTNVTGNTWTSSSVVTYATGAFTAFGAGSVTLSNTLDRVRITTVNGTDAFDAGSINIMYE